MHASCFNDANENGYQNYRCLSIALIISGFTHIVVLTLYSYQVDDSERKKVQIHQNHRVEVSIHQKAVSNDMTISHPPKPLTTKTRLSQLPKNATASTKQKNADNSKEADKILRPILTSNEIKDLILSNQPTLKTLPQTFAKKTSRLHGTVFNPELRDKRVKLRSNHKAKPSLDRQFYQDDLSNLHYVDGDKCFTITKEQKNGFAQRWSLPSRCAWAKTASEGIANAISKALIKSQ